MRTLKTHFAMPWYGRAVCGSAKEKFSGDPKQVNCHFCRRFNLSERSKEKGPQPYTVGQSL